MKFIAIEALLGTFFKELAKRGILKISEDQLFDFAFKLTLIYSNKVDADHNNAKRLVCNLRRHDIIAFTDKFKNYLSYSFLLRDITINQATIPSLIHSMEDRYETIIKNSGDEVMEAISEAIDDIF